jgi:dihydrofolate synthase/folylpolyglutamate synthase
VTGLLSRILQRAGYTVNLYNSPHLIRFNERITVHGRNISDELLLEAFGKIEQARRDTGISLTFFEITTLAAFYAFIKNPADFVILEVGMGGRYDSTNLLDAELAVITNVALDHTAFLGATREEIGYQKAGILKSGAKLVYGETDLPDSVAQWTRQVSGELFCLGRNYSFTLNREQHTFTYCGLHRTLADLQVPSIPVENAVNVLAALEVLKVNADEQLLREQISSFSMPGRMQKVMSSPDVYVDVGHNSHAFGFISRRLDLIASDRRCIAVVGMLRDKDFAVALNTIAPKISRFYIGSIPGERGTLASDLKNAIQDPQKRQNAECFDSVIDAFRKAQEDTSEHDLILVFGSFMTAGPVLEYLGVQCGL